MQKLRFVLICLLGSLHLAAQPLTETPNDYQLKNFDPALFTDAIMEDLLAGIKGKVKYFTQMEYHPIVQDTLVLTGSLKDSRKNLTYFIDKDKIIKEVWTYHPKGDIHQKRYYRDFKRDYLDSMVIYGASGKQISLQRYVYEPANPWPVKRLVTMLNETREVTYFSEKKGDLVAHELGDWVITYKNNLPVKRENNQRKQRWEYAWHPNGQLQSRVFYDKNDKMREEQFDQQGRLLLTEAYSYSFQGALLEIARDSFAYNAENLVEKQFKWNAAGQADQNGDSPLVVEYEYKNGLVKTIYETVGKEKKIKVQNFYNDKKELVKQYGKTGEVRFQYEGHDNAGNWTRKIIIVDGEPKTVIERKISYHGKK